MPASTSLLPGAFGTKKHKISVIGSGNWGSTIAKIVSESTRDHRELFEEDVQMWVHEEEVFLPGALLSASEHAGVPYKLSSVINKYHQNVKYLPGIDLPTNLVANPSIVDTVAGSTILIFNLPHQFIARACKEMQGHIVPFARGISCIKGVNVTDEGISLFSESIGHSLGIYTFKTLFHRPYFYVHCVPDVAGVSLSGALKNVVALAAGFVGGKGWGDNAKAAIMRVDLLEIMKFSKEFFNETIQAKTFTEESAGVADLITTCSGGRNFRCAKLSVERGVSVDEVEKTELNGQKLQGISTAREVHTFLHTMGKEHEYPLFTAVVGILDGGCMIDDIPELVARADA